MILGLFTLHTAKALPEFSKFEKLLMERYAPILSMKVTERASGSWFIAVKPYHAKYFPFMAMDMMIMLRALPCHVCFAHDILPIGANDPSSIVLEPDQEERVEELITKAPADQSHLSFMGFGPRIDVGLNGLSTLFVDILASLTRVESEVLSRMRNLQYEKYGDPRETKTFGLQKQVATQLEKSPVAIHKSLRSSKYHLLAEASTAMRGMLE